MKLEELNESGTQTDRLEQFLSKNHKIVDSESGRIIIQSKVNGKPVNFEIGIYGKQLSVHPQKKTDDGDINGEAENIEMEIETKFLKLNEDVLWEGDLGGEEYAFIISEGMARFVQSSKGGVLRGAAKSALNFVTNPVVAGLAAGYAIDAYAKYKRNKRTTTSFFAKGMQERKLYQEIVDTLMKTGKFKKTHEKHVDGGILWVLKRV